jgi:hypothetical protein
VMDRAGQPVQLRDNDHVHGRRSFAPLIPWSTYSLTVQPRATVNARSGSSWLSGVWSCVETRA